MWHTTDVPSRGSRASRKTGARLLRGSGDVDDSRAADFQESIASRGNELFVICGHGDGVRLGLFCGRSSEKRG